jgi:hypothetical protein
MGPGIDAPSSPASFGFGAPGLSYGFVPDFAVGDTNPHTELGLDPSYVNGGTAQWTGFFGDAGGYTENHYRSRSKQRLRGRR